ncbi:hypothetical protein KZZ07_05715 [Mameliella sp. CS4]|uniref:hypothetical protein n=1 Tax=Mameliella sp. CS4 TaxID=2862329 RepID=UPI001C5E0DC4|nr:hypothetical protein [Mameliella sp. CS4]MBW4982035.1 hypothetical protein [Mameliella sp. CS4]
MSAPLEHASSGRSLRAFLVLMLVWLAALTLWFALQASVWIVGALLLVSLPALIDFGTGRSAWLRLDDKMLSWGSGGSTGEVALTRITLVRFETRLDFSIRVRLVLDDGRRITLPQDSLPPHPRLQEALEARDIKTERHHFGLI